MLQDPQMILFKRIFFFPQENFDGEMVAELVEFLSKYLQLRAYQCELITMHV